MSSTPDEQHDRLRISWAPATADEVSAALVAGEADRSDDWPERLSAALAALRGWSVIRGVSVEHGEVDIRYGNLHMSGESRIESCRVWTPGPVIVVADSPDQCVGNEGNAIRAVTTAFPAGSRPSASSGSPA